MFKIGAMSMQADENPDITKRVPVVLPGLQCNGSEQSLDTCPDFDIGLDTELCLLGSDVHLICFSGSNPGASRPRRTPSRRLQQIARLRVTQWDNTP